MVNEGWCIDVGSGVVIGIGCEWSQFSSESGDDMVEGNCNDAMSTSIGSKVMRKRAGRSMKQWQWWGWLLGSCSHGCHCACRRVGPNHRLQRETFSRDLFCFLKKNILLSFMKNCVSSFKKYSDSCLQILILCC